MVVRQLAVQVHHVPAQLCAVRADHPHRRLEVHQPGIPALPANRHLGLPYVGGVGDHLLRLGGQDVDLAVAVDEPARDRSLGRVRRDPDDVGALQPVLDGRRQRERGLVVVVGRPADGGLGHVAELVPVRVDGPQDVPGGVVEELVDGLQRVVEVLHADQLLVGDLARVDQLVALGEGDLDRGLEAELVVGPWSARAAVLVRVPPERQDPRGRLAGADVALRPERSVLQRGGEQDGRSGEHQLEAGPVGPERPGDVALHRDGQRAELARPFGHLVLGEVARHMEAHIVATGDLSQSHACPPLGAGHRITGGAARL